MKGSNTEMSQLVEPALVTASLLCRNEVAVVFDL